MGLTHNILIGRTDMVHVSTLYIYTSKGSCDWHNDGWEQGCTRSLHCKIVILVQLKRFLLFFFSIKQAEWWCLWKSKRSNFLFFYHKWLCLYMFRKYFTRKNKHIYRLINPTHTEFIYLIGKFLQNNSTV